MAARPVASPRLGAPITNSFTDRLKNTRTPTGGEQFAYYLPDSKTEVQGAQPHGEL